MRGIDVKVLWLRQLYAPYALREVSIGPSLQRSAYHAVRDMHSDPTHAYAGSVSTC